MAQTVKVKGLKELQRAFSKANKGLAKEFKDGLREVAEPVRVDAERLAVRGVRNIGAGRARWGQMRTGVLRHSVYVAPRERGRGGGSPRPNLADLLMNRAMQPALDQNQDRIVRGVEDLLDNVGKSWER